MGPLVLNPVIFSGPSLPADAPGPITVYTAIVLTGALASGTVRAKTAHAVVFALPFSHSL